ncbi:MAG: ANTAR domain-containing response regulator [Nocardioides sp.]
MTNPAAHQPGSDRLRAVIAEDEALIRMDLAEMLAEEGYDVVGQAKDGLEAIQLARELTPDLVILDVKMPRLDGIAAAERIAGERIAPIVILTAFSQRELIERARDAGAMAYVVKPFSRGDLVPAIAMAGARFAEIASLEAEVADLSARLETRKLVDRAKAVLQAELGLSESDAFRWIQKTAMDLRIEMRGVADGVLTHGVPKPSGQPEVVSPSNGAVPGSPD